MHGISDRVRSQCRLIVEHTRLVAGGVRVGLLLYDETTRLLTPVASTETEVPLQQVANELIERNHPGFTIGNLTYPPNVNPVVAAAFVGQRTQITPMAEALENIYPPSVMAVARGIAGITHIATCPVVWEGRCLGIVRFQLSTQPTDALQALMEAAASQIGLTLGNAELVEQMRRQLGATHAVGEVARLGMTEGVDATVRALVERVRQIADADTALVYLLDPSGTMFRAAARCVVDDKEKVEIARADKPLGPPHSVGEGLAGWVIASGEAAFVQDDRLDPRVQTRRPFAPRQAIIAVPMRVEGRTIGCLRVTLTGSRHFTEADLWLAQTLADEAALAIDSASRHEQALLEARRKGAESAVALLEEAASTIEDLRRLSAPGQDDDDVAALKARLTASREAAERLEAALQATQLSGTAPNPHF